MSKFKGKRMVEEDLIKKLQDLDPSGGTEYTAGTGIEISDENEISVDTDTIATVAALQSFTQTFGGELTAIYNGTTPVGKARQDASGRTFDEYYASKSELFSGDYNDLTNKPTIPEGVTIVDISTSATYTSGAITNFINKPGNYLFREVDSANGDDYFRINTIMSGAIMLTKTFVSSSTSLYSEIFYINRSTGAVTKYNYTINVPTAPTLNKTTETLTFTYSDSTTGTLTVVTDVTLS